MSLKSSNQLIKATAGFTLIELLIVLTIFGITINQGYPHWQNWLHRHDSQLAKRRIQQVIDYAQLRAIAGLERVKIIIAEPSYHNQDRYSNHRLYDDIYHLASNNDKNNDVNWNQTLEVRTAGGQLLKTFPPLSTRGTLTWHGGLARQEIIFKNDGSCSYQGHFIYRYPTLVAPSSKASGANAAGSAASTTGTWKMTLPISGQTHITYY